MVPAESTNKRQKNEKRVLHRSRIFQPFRAIGYITNDIPIVVESRGQDFFMTTSVGRNFQTYNLAKMNLLFVGPQSDRPITAMTSAQGVTYTACENIVLGFKRGREVSRVGGEGVFSIFQIVMLGPYVAALCDDNKLRLWDTVTKELYTIIEFDSEFTVSYMLHPNTYLNKLLIASTQGTMQLWNIHRSTMVYQFKSFGSPITYLSQPPVIDVIAIGLLDGTVLLYNIKVDQRIDSVRQSDRVTAISFRSDEEQMMATADMHGDVTLWDLKTRRVIHIMKGAHAGAISSLSFLNGQPILVTAGSDNAVKQWIFSKKNEAPVLFKSRSGHYAQPSKIRYYSEDGKVILSAGRDRSLRAFSVVRDSQSVELSQGRIASKANARKVAVEELKLEQIISFASERSKEKQWDNILTSHTNDSGVHTWSMKDKRIGSHKLISLDGSEVKVVYVTACGNFGLLGCKSGSVFSYNMQSGIFRQAYSDENGHSKPITGLATDSVNKLLITASVDKTVKIWNFKTARLLHTIELDAQVESIYYRRENNLLAAVCDNRIWLIDIETQKVVREFLGHTNRITDMDFSPDGRWIVSAAVDATIRTWDLPTGTMVDLFRVEDVVTSLSFSPTGDFLATAHVDNVGICLWANRALFSNVSLHSIPIDEEAKLLSLPSLSLDDDEDECSDDSVDMTPSSPIDGTTSEQLADELITLSLEPRSKWQNLLNLDTIKQRNKPKEAPKAPEKAPFFLPTVAGAAPKFDTTNTNQNDVSAMDTGRPSFGSLNTETEFTRLLQHGHESGDYTAFVNYTKSLNPSAIDLEIRSITVDSGLTQLNHIVEAILFMIQTRKNFELAQAWLNVLLTVHSDLIIANPDNAIHGKLSKLLEAQQNEFGRLSEQLHYGLCLLDYARRA